MEISRIKLRYYQENLKQKTRNAFRNNKRVLMLAACGSGKTITSTSIISDSVSKGKKVWFVVHRKELLDQAVETMERCNVDMTNVTVCMIQTMVRRLNKATEVPDLIVVDEAHHCSSSSYEKTLNHFPEAFVLGLTATPCRLSGKPLGDMFDIIVTDITVSQLVEQGYLCQYDYYAPELSADFKKVKLRAGDFDEKEVEKEMDKARIYGDIIKHYEKYAKGKKTIIYCPTISFSQKIEARFLEAGYSIKHFDGTTKKAERDQIIEDFRAGRINMLTNVDLIGEGFDVPDCDCCMLLRPTQSLSLYIQQSTRCLRPKENKRAVVLDYVGNCFRHGLPTEDREWSLTEKVVSKNKSGEKDILVRQCESCFRTYSGTGTICPYCGFDNGKTQQQLEEEKRAELVRITEIKKKQEKKERQAEKWRKEQEKKKLQKQRKEEEKNKSYEELVQLGYSRGYEFPEQWAKRKINLRESYRRYR